MLKPRRRQVTPLLLAAALFAALIGTAAVAQSAAPAGGEQQLINIDVKEAPVEQVLRMLAKAANVNILIGQDVKGTVEAVSLRDVTVDAALRLIAKSQGFYWTKEENVYVVSKTPPVEVAAAPQATAPQGTPTAPPAPTPPTPTVPVPGGSGSVAPPPLPGTQTYSAPTPAAAAQPEIVSKMLPLAYADAREVALMFGGTYTSGGAADTLREMSALSSRRSGGLGNRGGRSNSDVFANGYSAPTAGGGLGLGQDFGDVGGNTGRGGRSSRGGRNSGDQGGSSSGRGGLSGGRSGGSGGGVLDTMLPGDMQAPVAFLPQNALLVQGTQEDIDKFREILDLLDKPTKQVEISVKFIEVQTTADQALGIDWSISNGQLEFFNQGFAPAEAVNNVVRFARGRFEAQLNALLSSGRATVINEPHVVAQNNQYAEINFETTIPYFSATVSYNQYGTREVDFTSESIDVNNGLICVPRINADDSVTVYLEPELDDTIGTVEGPNGESIPIETSQYVTTTVRVADGETVVLGGLVRKDESSNTRETPLLSRIPIIGKLFRSRSVTKSNSELLIFVTPRIIRDTPAD